MAPLQRHPWGFNYLRLRFLAFLLRALVYPGTRAKIRRQTMVEGVTCKRITVPSRDAGRSIVVDVYSPDHYDSTKPMPVMVNMHGSGFLFPMLGTDRRYCSTIAARTHSLVFDMDYRKAPEHPYPAAPQDLEDVVAHLLAHPRLYDAANIFLSGFSSGGTAALPTAAALGPARIKGVVAIYARADGVRDYPRPQAQMGEGVPRTPWLSAFARECYFLPGVDRADARVSAQHAPAERFPAHVYLACGDADWIHGNMEAFVRKLKDAGHGDAMFESIEREGHAFDKGSPGTASWAKAEKMYEAVAAMVNRAIRS
ncbi:hypothetical protein HWV62_32987 [Athelia sp. TMB]|nr:hypothetical protein HWV62_32987 [Athelia sp. TMB]